MFLSFLILKKKERKTGLGPATPTLARLYSTPEPLAHLLIYISARFFKTDDIEDTITVSICQ